MNLTVPASIPVLRWAAERARLDDFALVKRFRKWPLWLSGEAQPTLRQIEDFARMTHTPFGYFFLPEPPRMELPVPDFRSLRDAPVREPSIDLLDTVYLCQRRQDWFREYARINGLPPVPFVGEVRVGDVPEAVAAKLRDTLDLSVTERQTLPTWTDALRQLIARTEDAGVLVMASSIVGANSHRKLDVDEFRGFALADHLAPLVFLNAGDSKAAQMFSLAHELAHLALGQSSISDAEAGRVPERTTERWCNKVAAELLMPLAAMREAVQREAAIEQEIQRLARLFKVSTLVALRRLFDAGLMGTRSRRRHVPQDRCGGRSAIRRRQHQDHRAALRAGGDQYLLAGGGLLYWRPGSGFSIPTADARPATLQDVFCRRALITPDRT